MPRPHNLNAPVAIVATVAGTQAQSPEKSALTVKARQEMEFWADPVYAGRQQSLMPGVKPRKLGR